MKAMHAETSKVLQLCHLYYMLDWELAYIGKFCLLSKMCIANMRRGWVEQKLVSSCGNGMSSC